ncbi:MAG: lysylphosphatidylglycerol synthase transmembrane domain-containing protein [Anaerolineae bacterium]
MNRKRLFDLLKIVVSLALIVVILRSVDLNALWKVARGANPWYLLAAQAALMLGVGVRAYRWQILVEDQGVNVSLRELTALYFVGFLFNNLLPSGFGGDAVKMYELSQRSQRGAEAVSSVLVDRFMGLIALQAIGLIALVFSWRLVPTEIVLLTVALFSVSLVAAWVVSYRPLWGFLAGRVPLFDRLLSIKAVNSLVSSLQSYSGLALLRSLGVGLVFNVILIAANVLIGMGLGVELPLAYYMIFVPLTSLVLILPISFAGLGVREGTYVVLFKQAGVATEVALSMSLLVYVLGTVTPGLVGGIIYILRGARGYGEARQI